MTQILTRTQTKASEWKYNYVFAFLCINLYFIWWIFKLYIRILKHTEVMKQTTSHIHTQVRMIQEITDWDKRWLEYEWEKSSLWEMKEKHLTNSYWIEIYAKLLSRSKHCVLCVFIFFVINKRYQKLFIYI